jgi:hypothetical protein
LLALCGVGADASRCLAQGKSKRRTVQSSSARVPVGTQMKVRLETTVDAKEARNGDRFTATVITPSRYEGSTIEGHVARVEQSGKIKGRTSISLAFDRIRFRDGGSAVFGAQVVRVYGEESVKKVDEEGNVESGSRGSQTAKRTAGGAAVGAIIGGLAGGGKGAAIGAAVGGAAGAGSLVIQGSKKLKLESGTEMLIRSTR